MSDEIRTSGDLRRSLAQTIEELRSGKISIGTANAIATQAKEITAQMQVEVNVAKAKLAIIKEGYQIGKLTHLGRMAIDGRDETPVLPEDTDKETE